MRVGSLTFATEQGLGILAKSFYDHGIITDFLIVEHSSRKTHPEWYPKSESVRNTQIYSQTTLDFIAEMDVMLFFETPFHWNLLDHCRDNGVKTVLMPMYECMPKTLPREPDRIICPSLLDLQCYPQGTFIPVPVDVPWKQRTKAEVFVHNAGHGGLRGRNGTAELIKAIPFIKSPIKLLIRRQSHFRSEADTLFKQIDDPRVELFEGSCPQEELWSYGDVFVFPEKFNGLSLPLQEALASGMYVIATDRFPMNTWLPRQGLIRPIGSDWVSIGRNYANFSESILSPQDIAAKIDETYGQDITDHSLAGAIFAEQMTWERLKPSYQAAVSF